MMLPLTQVKKHLRVTSEDEDTLIQLYLDAAEKHIVHYIDDPYLGTPWPSDLDDFRSEPDLNADDIPAPIKAACLLFVADLYENREAQGEAVINENPAVSRLLFPYRLNLGV